MKYNQAGAESEAVPADLKAQKSAATQKHFLDVATLNKRSSLKLTGKKSKNKIKIKNKIYCTHKRRGAGRHVI